MMRTILIDGAMSSAVLVAVLAAGAATVPVAPAHEMPPFLPVPPYEPPAPPWTRINPRAHYRMRRPGRAR